MVGWWWCQLFPGSIIYFNEKAVKQSSLTHSRQTGYSTGLLASIIHLFYSEAQCIKESWESVVTSGSTEQTNIEEKNVITRVKQNFHTVDKHDLEKFITGPHTMKDKILNGKAGSLGN